VSENEIGSVVIKKVVGKFSIAKPFNGHVHLRELELLLAVLIHTLRHFEAAVVMPNLEKIIRTVAQALAYRAKILELAYELTKRTDAFNPRMTLYATDDMDPAEIDKAVESGCFASVKVYPLMGTTNAQAGLQSVRNIPHVLERMQKLGLPLSWHAETPGSDTDIDEFDREAVCLERDGLWLLENFPDLKVVIEHVTTRQGVQFVMAASDNVSATVTPQHVTDNRTALFRYAGKIGLRPDHWCLPVLKRDSHRWAVLNAILTGDPKFFAGTDSAPHPIGRKHAECCSGGIFNEPVAIPLYTKLFSAHGDQELEDSGAPKWIRDLEAFLSLNGRRFYGLPVPEERLTIVREDWSVPKLIEGTSVRIYKAEEVLPWKVQG
jgi:dihydroorotase